jgi:hypothetical protein
MVYAK